MKQGGSERETMRETTATVWTCDEEIRESRDLQVRERQRIRKSGMRRFGAANFPNWKKMRRRSPKIKSYFV